MNSTTKKCMLSWNVFYIYRNTSPATHTCYLWNNSITSLQFSCRQHPCFIVSPGNELLFTLLQCATCIDKKYAFPINNGSWTKKRITNLSCSVVTYQLSCRRRETARHDIRHSNSIKGGHTYPVYHHTFLKGTPVSAC